MPRPAPLTDADRARILELHAQGMSRNDIHRETGRSAAAVTKVVHDAGLSFDRSATAAATEARKADLAARRASLREKYLQRADELLEQMTQPCTVFNFGGKDNTYAEHQLTKPPVKDLRDLMQAASIATTAEIRIAQADQNQGVEAARSLLAGIAGALGLTPDDEHDDAA